MAEVENYKFRRKSVENMKIIHKNMNRDSELHEQI